MERAPFEWAEPAEDREPEITPRVERIPSGKPDFGQPYVWAPPRPRYVDDTPKMGRIGSAAFLGFLVLLAFGAVWVVERDVGGLDTREEPLPKAATLEPPAADVPVVTAQESEPEGPPPSTSTSATPVEQSPEQRPAPRAIETASPPPRRVPLPTSPPLSQQAMRTPLVDPPPRVAAAVAEPGPLARVPVEEPPVVAPPPVTSPPETPPAPASVPTPALAAPPMPAPVPPTTAASPGPSIAAASPAPPRPAPATAPSTATKTAVVDVDNTAIRDVLGRYRSAFNTLDVKAAQQVWPTVNQRTLDRAFGQLQEQNVSFDRCTIAVKGVIAEANCNGTTRFVPRVGSRSEQIESRQWNFSLRKAYSGGWVIQEVRAR